VGMPELPEDVRRALSPDADSMDEESFEERFRSEFDALRAREDASDSDMSDLGKSSWVFSRLNE
jgi:hypothetical protein